MSIESIDIGLDTLTEHETRTDQETYLFAALVDLENTSHIFIKKVDEDKLDGVNGFTRFFDVIDTFGVRMFQIIEKTPPELRKRRGQEEFLLNLVDSRGEVLFEYEGEIGERFEMIRSNHIWGGISRNLEEDGRFTYPLEFWKLDEEGIPMSDLLVRESPNLPHPSTVRTILKKKNKDGGSKKTVSTQGSISGPKEPRKTVIFAERIESPREVLFIVGEKQKVEDLCCCSCCRAPVPTSRGGKSLELEAALMLPDKTTRVGRISKCWSSTDAIHCEKSEVESLVGIHFPKRTDVRIKALLIGVLFMLDPELFAPKKP